MTVTITNAQFEQFRKLAADYNECKQKLEAIREIVNRVDTDSDKVYNVKKALDK